MLDRPLNAGVVFVFVHDESQSDIFSSIRCRRPGFAHLARPSAQLTFLFRKAGTYRLEFQFISPEKSGGWETIGE
jgi:hypothetical protein